MHDLGVPCPACGSLEVEVGQPAAVADTRADAADSPRGHVPVLCHCACRDCRLTFRHDFAFSR